MGAGDSGFPVSLKQAEILNPKKNIMETTE
jgi:hypothetical protein